MSATTFFAVLGGTSLLAVTARRFRPPPELPTLESWALADRRLGTPTTWFLLGGTIYTAYTFAAVPGLVYGTGAIGFFALPYTVIVYPIAFVLLPRLWAEARRHGYITIADLVRGRHGSPALALVVAVTGVLATMPYIALQLVGIRAVLSAGGLYPRGALGDLALVGVFAVLAVATYRHGLRAPAVISLMKGAAIFCSALAVASLVLARLGGPGPMFAAAERTLSAGPAYQASLTLDPGLFPVYVTLALGSALALLLYPHVLTATFAASSPDTLRRALIAMPAWTGVLALFALLGVAALAAGIQAPPGSAEAAVPLLVRELMPAALTGLVFGALTVGALVPAAVMSIAVATSFVRDIYVELFHPTATPKHQTRIAQLVSLSAKIGAVVFVFGLRDQDAINLQLLGGVWILQTFPAVVIGVFTRRLHHQALLVGWGAGMVGGTLMVVYSGFSSLVPVSLGGQGVQAYAAVVALALNLAVVIALTPLCNRMSRISRSPFPSPDMNGPVPMPPEAGTVR
ncbi:sodium:solute symporter family protein [Sphaerisporangium perillae]|uniref:sodium:solute symporter family protein n=1 Tax=Sphaerisporangium perillae TaxID=2935860 RepID=UPI00200C24C4|nr:sodium:solute symporter [Sphaerisporangium perillae]